MCDHRRGGAVIRRGVGDGLMLPREAASLFLTMTEPDGEPREAEVMRERPRPRYSRHFGRGLRP